MDFDNMNDLFISGSKKMEKCQCKILIYQRIISMKKYAWNSSIQSSITYPIAILKNTNCFDSIQYVQFLKLKVQTFLVEYVWFWDWFLLNFVANEFTIKCTFHDFW